MAQDQGTRSVSHRSVRLLIEGRVQGVGYRAFVDLEARGAGLDGWVRNRRDGAVEAMFAGPADTVERMLALCKRGPAHARVDMVKIVGEGEPADPGFLVRPTV